MISFGENTIRIPIDNWGDFKSLLVRKKLTPQGETKEGLHRIFAIDGVVIYTCNIMDDGNPDSIDYVANYKDIVSGPSGAKTSDGKQISLNNMFRGGVNVVHTSRADDLNTGALWGGEKFEIRRTKNESDQGVTCMTFGFFDDVYLAGGKIVSQKASFGDYIDYKIFAPSSAPAELVGSDWTKNAGKYIYTQGSGTVGLDLTATLNGNVTVTKATPVPSPTRTGQIDYKDGAITLNGEGTGEYDIYYVDVDLHRFLVEAPLLGDAGYNLNIPAIKPKKVLKQWRHAVNVFRNGINDVDVGWLLFIARERTV